MTNRGSLRTSVALLALVLLACEGPAAEPCEGPACEAGAPGGGGGAPACADHAAASACRDDDFDDPCGAQVCALATRSCPDGERCCVLGLSCEDAVGPAAGGTLCSSDEECASGLCLEISGVKSCFRPCSEAGASGGCPTGQHCEAVGLFGGATTRSCVGGTAEARDPEATICTRPRDCTEGRDCRIVNGASILDGVAIALCLPPAPADWFDACAPDPALGISAGFHGELASEACPSGGLCFDACRGEDSYGCYCADAQLGEGTCRAFRCTGVCSRDDDCPDRSTCQGLVGTLFDFQEPMLTFSVCRLPRGEPLDWSCWDELDCCAGGVRETGAPCCRTEFHGEACVDPPVAVEVTHCRFVPGEARYLTRCAPPAGLLEPGARCDGHEACESGLCADDGAAGRVCVTACDVRFDRCPDIVAGTSCCPTQVEAAGVAHCVPTCRTSCESPAACTL